MCIMYGEDCVRIEHFYGEQHNWLGTDEMVAPHLLKKD